MRQKGQSQPIHLEFIRKEVVESQTKYQKQSEKSDYHIDPGKVLNNYLKLISGTSFEEDNNSDGVCTRLFIYQLESSNDNDGDKEEFYGDYDYEDEMIFESNEEFSSIESEIFHIEDQLVVSSDYDQHFTNVINTKKLGSICSHKLVNINVTFGVDNMSKDIRLSSRGRGRGRERHNRRVRRQNTREKGVKHISQQLIFTAQDHNLSN